MDVLVQLKTLHLTPTISHRINNVYDTKCVCFTEMCFAITEQVDHLNQRGRK